MKWIKFLLPVVVIIIAVVGMKGIEASAPEEKDKKAIDTRPKVTVEAIPADTYTVMISSYGEVRPLESTNLAAQVSGEIVSWNENFLAGGLVKRGEVLFTIEKDAYEAALLMAEANLATAQAQLIQEQALADVAEREAKLLPKSKVTDLYLRKPQVLSAQAALKSAQAQLRIAKRDLDNCEVRAPYDALVISRDIGLGDFVGVGARTAVLNNIETAEITFPVAGFDLPFLADEMANQAALVTLNDPLNTQRKAYIHRDSGIVDEQTRMTHFVARIDDPYGIREKQAAIKFGSFVTLEFEGKQLPNVYKIPQSLVNNNRVWTLDEDNKLVSQAVTVVREEGEHMLIAGRFNAQRVVTTLPEYPQAGLEVKIIEPESDTNELVAQSPASM